MGIGIALVAAGVVSVLSIFYTIMGVTLFVPIVTGLLSDRPSSTEALASIVSGTIVVGAFQLLHGGKPLSGVTPAMGGLAAAIVAFLVAYTIRRIMGGPSKSDRTGSPSLSR